MTTRVTAPSAGPPAPSVSPEALALTRRNVKELLTQSPAFQALPPDRQREIARNTVEVASYLAEPDGLRVQPGTTPLAQARAGAPGGDFTAQGAREGAAVAGALLREVNFPEFVAELVQGVFHAIVTSSIQQMEAYGALVADVAKTLNQFRDENVSVNEGRDHLVDSFPDLFELTVDTGFEGGPAPRVALREGVDDRAALQRVSSLPVEGEPLGGLDDDTIEERLVPAARTQLATSRQQLLATMVMMGINRIVVTDGRIQAKVLYDFQARDTFRRQTSATRFDYGDQYRVTSEGEYESDYQGGEYERDDEGTRSRGASYYSQGKYKTTAEPVLKLVSATQESTDAALQTKASLAGLVDINFKSDFFPLEKMADSFQIAQIQDAAKPGRASAGPPQEAGQG